MHECLKSIGREGAEASERTAHAESCACSGRHRSKIQLLANLDFCIEFEARFIKIMLFHTQLGSFFD